MRRRQSRRQAFPRLWLMTDERQGESLWTALENLPRRSGIVFRHYSLPAAERRKLFLRIERVARKRKLMLVAANPRELGRPRLEGVHNHASPFLRARVRTASAHDRREVIAAERAGADLIFLSPVFPTRSHPEAAGLGPVRFGLLARRSRCRIVALGGMDRRRGRQLEELGAYGWAAIDAWR